MLLPNFRIALKFGIHQQLFSTPSIQVDAPVWKTRVKLWDSFRKAI
jgi:regulatory protein YycI of two-component signal transduction system YycFG